MEDRQKRGAAMKTNLTPTLRITLLVLLILLTGLSVLQMIPPRAMPASAPASQFSAGRAMADLAVVAREPHSAGSAAQAHVRDYIVSQVTALGLKAEIQASGQVANILVRIPGSNPTQPVLVTGHYDSHPPAPGAGDDGISVVAMLESLRVLHVGPSLRNDLLFLFTDGEESGWLGAKAYLYTHPQGNHETGVVLCFDARPGNGNLVLQQTSPGDGWLVRQMTGLPLSLVAGSWTNPDERTDDDTDFESFQAFGYTGMELENEPVGNAYHTSHDTVAAISPKLVQAYGQSLLALTGRFGNLDFTTKTSGADLMYFSLPLIGLIAYPGWVMTLLSSLGVLAWLASLLIAWRQGRFSIGRSLLSLPVLLVGIALITLAGNLAWGMILKQLATARGANAGLAATPPWLAGLIMAAGLLMVLILTVLSRRLGVPNVAAAAGLVYLMIGFAYYLFGDGGNPLTTAWLAWPFLGSVLGMGALLFIRNPVWKVILLACSAFLMLALMVPQIWMGAYTIENAWIPILVTCAWTGLFTAQVTIIFPAKPLVLTAFPQRARDYVADNPREVNH
jgi:hypothetical protein